VADALKREFDLDDVELISGRRGEFTVWLGEKLLVKKDYDGFPSPEQAVAAMRAALA
jgi:hypothetical protein